MYKYNMCFLIYNYKYINMYIYIYIYHLCVYIYITCVAMYMYIYIYKWIAYSFPHRLKHNNIHFRGCGNNKLPYKTAKMNMKIQNDPEWIVTDK